MEEHFYLFSSCPMDSLHRMNLDGTMELKRSQREFLPAPHELEVTYICIYTWHILMVDPALMRTSGGFLCDFDR